tara:strand:- start:588 stop:743 length:156 start_codon:yes stop_codon:yes gene_type:complete
MYKKTINMLGNIDESMIKRISDGACIPKDPDNRDYQDYLAWVAKGNKINEA